LHSRENTLLIDAYYAIADARRRRAVDLLIKQLSESRQVEPF
jgi:hypothetical protein